MEEELLRFLKADCIQQTVQTLAIQYSECTLFGQLSQDSIKLLINILTLRTMMIPREGNRVQSSPAGNFLPFLRALLILNDYRTSWTCPDGQVAVVVAELFKRTPRPVTFVGLYFPSGGNSEAHQRDLVALRVLEQRGMDVRFTAPRGSRVTLETDRRDCRRRTWLDEVGFGWNTSPHVYYTRSGD